MRNIARAFVATLVLLVVGAPAFATEPGTPMDCSDLELAPGLTCTMLSKPGGFRAMAAAVVDNDGRVLVQGQGSTSDVLEVIGSCGTTSLTRSALLYHDGGNGSRTPLVSVRSRCLDASASRVEYARFANVFFHSVPGSLLVTVNSLCNGPLGAECPGYGGGTWSARIDGFTPLADVLPPPAPLCANGLDDDGDGTIDADDHHCIGDADNDESRP